MERDAYMRRRNQGSLLKTSTLTIVVNLCVALPTKNDTFVQTFLTQCPKFGPGQNSPNFQDLRKGRKRTSSPPLAGSETQLGKASRMSRMSSMIQNNVPQSPTPPNNCSRQGSTTNHVGMVVSTMPTWFSTIPNRGLQGLVGFGFRTIINPL